MTRDLGPIELPPSGETRAAPDPDDHTSIDPAQVGNTPIDDLDAGIDAAHLGAPGEGVRPDQPGDRPGIEHRGPVHGQPAPEGSELDQRSKLAKTIDPTGTDAGQSVLTDRE